MAQLARRSQRKLLGQEWTPHWLARLLADRCIDGLPNGESPRIVDMCCGSGTMLAEIIKATRVRFGFSAIEQLEDVATGFDIERSEEHTSELQSLMRNSYAVFCLTKKKIK